MAKRIYVNSNNILVIAENTDLTDDKRNPVSNVYTEINGTIYAFYKKSVDELIESIDFSNILDVNGVAYTSQSVFTNLIERTTNNTNGTAFVSAVRTATVSSADIYNNFGKGIHIILDVTAVAISDIKMKIEGKDSVSGKYYTILESASVTTAVTNVYKVHPSLTASINLVANDFVPKIFRITMTHANVNATTYSVGYNLV
jgi:hypothetical protein